MGFGRRLCGLAASLVLLSWSEAFSPVPHLGTKRFATSRFLFGKEAASSAMPPRVGFAPTKTKLKDGAELEMFPAKPKTMEWEIDCFSRPVVMEDGKKLWDLLITDTWGSFRYSKTIPANEVNSKELRNVIEDFLDEYGSDPDAVRYFRGEMANMLRIALEDLNIKVIPSRNCCSLYNWLEERHDEVYPQMKGFKKVMIRNTANENQYDARPKKMPDEIRGEKYAFVGLPLAEFLPGGGINEQNVGMGRLCPLPSFRGVAAGDTFVQGIVILTERGPEICKHMNEMEIVGVKCNLNGRQVYLQEGISMDLLFARLNEEQRKEGVIFEEGKLDTKGLHFISVQKDETQEIPDGFYLFREVPKGI